jgi:rSAM/selenodomain-associated transferase 1
MAKAPVPGAVKTRLCPPLTPEQAAELSRCFLLDTLDRVVALPAISPVLAFSPPGARRALASMARGARLVAQRGTDLGERLENLLAGLLAAGHPAAIAVGTDTPSLPAAYLRRAVAWLAAPGPDVVLGPSDDGGYYLIGMRTLRPTLFAAMPWSTPAVLPRTLRRARAAGLEVACLPPWFDVDTGADLERLRAALRRGHGGPAPRTAAFLGVARAGGEAR